MDLLPGIKSRASDLRSDDSLAAYTLKPQRRKLSPLSPDTPANVFFFFLPSFSFPRGRLSGAVPLQPSPSN